jgi:hypothetical protein
MIATRPEHRVGGSFSVSISASKSLPLVCLECDLAVCRPHSGNPLGSMLHENNDTLSSQALN